MNFKRYILIVILFIVAITANAQVFSVNGTVSDSVTKQKLAFVNVIINNAQTYGTITDIDGNFTVKSKNEIKTLTFSCVGYQKKTVPAEALKNKSNKILLRPISVELQEVVVYAGENPAHRIIDSVVKNRKRNNPEMLNSYSYTIYDQMIVTLDTTKLNDSSLINVNKLVRDNDIMVMETVSEQYHKRPNKNKREIKANIISGLKNPMYFYVIDGMQSTSFYDDFITVYEKNYVNPITPGSKSKYFFGLESVMPTENNDSIYTISFKPRRGTTFNALKGVMTITSDGWAVVNVKAEAADKSNTLDVKIQQLYAKINDSVWFPVQLNTDIVFFRMVADNRQLMISNKTPEDANTSINGIGKSYISNIKINPEIDKKVFGSTDIDIAEDSGMKDEIYWRYYRNDSLNERILNTYKFVDTIMEKGGIDLDRVMNTFTDIVSKGSIPMGYVNLNLSEILNYNIANNFYLGLGLRTNERLSKYLAFGGYLGYWFGPKHANYGGDFEIKFNRKQDFGLKLSYDHIYKAVGDYGFMGAPNLLDESFFRYYYVKWTTLNTAASAELSTRFAKICKGSVNFSLSDKEMYDWYSYDVGDSIYNGKFRLSTLDFKLRIAFGERYMLSPKGLVTVSKGKPVIWLSYQKGLKDVLDCPFNFDKIQFQMTYSWLTRYIGKTTVSLQAGCVFGDAPVMETFNIFGNNDEFGLYATQSFATMLINEFISDRFAALFFDHNFGKMFKTKYLSPELIVVTNIGWGDISDVQKHQGVELKSMKDGFYESGIVIDNILNINFMKMGFGSYYRYGPNSLDEDSKNFAFKLKVSFAF
ncbi:MAG: carboxypeptidase-like regulatory domain-containing protein [Bacteroidales bacterium]|nr:carboxypeptidase-like regulatory domain-containing protein [Bacteroidales bacterium]